MVEDPSPLQAPTLSHHCLPMPSLHLGLSLPCHYIQLPQLAEASFLLIIHQCSMYLLEKVEEISGSKLKNVGGAHT
jgi:hypothetical protein